MKEHPILFSRAMVLAILAGQKTVTRRLIVPQPLPELHAAPTLDSKRGLWTWRRSLSADAAIESFARVQYRSGDRAWIRETWHPCDSGALFAADYPEGDEGKREAGVERWKPGIHLPRAEARGLLDITADERVERLREITGSEIIREGAVDRAHYEDHLGKMPVSAFNGRAYVDLVSLWRDGWDSINGARYPWATWAANPWVRRVEFRRAS